MCYLNKKNKFLIIELTWSSLTVKSFDLLSKFVSNLNIPLIIEVGLS